VIDNRPCYRFASRNDESANDRRDASRSIAGDGNGDASCTNVCALFSADAP